MTVTDKDYLLSRQPVYDSKVNVAAYELRSAHTPETAVAIYNMFTSAGLDHIVGEHEGIISLIPEVLSDDLWRQIPSSRVTLAYFADIEPRKESIRKVFTLAKKGYRIAVSDSLSRDSLETLGNVANIIKLDITRYMPDEMERRIRDLRCFDARLLAEQVSTYDEMEYSKGLGFDLYQGVFLCKPSARKKELPVNRLTMIRLLAKLQDPKLAIADLEKIISLDVTLSYKLLQYANSAALALPRDVTSIGHAVRMLGMDVLKTWSTALLLSSVEDKPQELMNLSLVRARMCERLAEAKKDPDKDTFLSAGLLSVLDALLDCPMDKAVAELPLADEIKEALVNQTGPIGQALRCTIAYERADWDNVKFDGVPLASIRESYMDAIAWARKLVTGLLA
ncbi:MAG TPA: HDOD domain-containing protein [Terriglobia bacterium]|nr:HDOD domain-containing protein [Terriglobia bacterium]